MARLQILELPEGSGDDRPPFVLVIDQAPTDDAGFDAIRRDLGTPEDLVERIGARAVLVFEETIDIPGNDVPLDPDGYPVKMRIEPDFETFREQVQDEIRKTQRELTQAVNRDPASERTEITREMYLLVKKKGELLDALGMDPTRDWDDIRNAAAGLRKERDTQAETLEQLRAGEEPYTDERIAPTPGQWIWKWNRATPEKRLSMAGQILDGMPKANDCFMADHEAQITSLRAEVDRLRSNSSEPDA